MPIKKGYIDNDVYNEAKKRIRRIITAFDSIVVCFSGGKDSLAALHLCQEVYDEMGITKKLSVIFRDEELIPDDVINFVLEVRNSGKYNFRYYAIPLQGDKFILGKTYKYVQWDRDRKWLRQPPEFAITLPPDQYRVYDQYSLICKEEKGRVALITGIRADESLTRFRACVNKQNENYINATKDPRISICKPLYDWTENDIFLYFYKKKIKYCPIYDIQMLNGEGLRVSTPLHSESAKRFSKIKTRYPVFYQQLVELFPEMKVQDRYYSQLNKGGGDYSGYEHTLEGLIQYIEDRLDDPHIREIMLERVESAWQRRKNNEAKGATNLGGYPLRYLFACVDNGYYKRVILPKGQPTKADYDFENQ